MQTGGSWFSLVRGGLWVMKAKLYLLFNDRLGIVADISTLVAGVQSSITSMEVERAHDKAAVYLELENGRPDFSQAAAFRTTGQGSRSHRNKVHRDPSTGNEGKPISSRPGQHQGRGHFHRPRRQDHDHKHGRQESLEL